MPEQHQKVAVHALIKRDGKYLLTRRSQLNDYKPGEWDIPGGSVEFSEDPQKALEREVDEESKLKVKIGKPVHIYSHVSNLNRHQFQIIYECEYLSGEVKLNPEEHDQAAWSTWEEMAQLPLIAFMQSFIDKTQFTQ